MTPVNHKNPQTSSFFQDFKHHIVSSCQAVRVVKSKNTCTMIHSHVYHINYCKCLILIARETTDTYTCPCYGNHRHEDFAADMADVDPSVLLALAACSWSISHCSLIMERLLLEKPRNKHFSNLDFIYIGLYGEMDLDHFNGKLT